MPSRAELNQLIASYESLIATFTRVREQLIIRRHGATDHVMAELDERIATNARTIEALSRGVEMMRHGLNILDHDKE
jgi:hypothetical protein